MSEVCKHRNWSWAQVSAWEDSDDVVVIQMCNDCGKDTMDGVIE